MSRQLRHTSGGDQCFCFSKIFSWEEHGFKILCLNFQGSFPTPQNKTSNFKLPASVTPLAKRTYTGSIANTTVVVMLGILDKSFQLSIFHHPVKPLNLIIILLFSTDLSFTQVYCEKLILIITVREAFR